MYYQYGEHWEYAGYNTRGHSEYQEYPGQHTRGCGDY